MGYRRIHEAARNGDVDFLREELETVSPNLVDGLSGFAPLHYVASCAQRYVKGDTDNRVACIRLLVAEGANVNSTTAENTTAIFYAARGGYTKLVAALLDAGADVNHLDGRFVTPLHDAMYSTSPDCTRLLINAGAAVDTIDSFGRTPLDECITSCQRYLRGGYVAESERQRRHFPILLRAGAALPAECQTDDAYLRKVIAAGSFQNYERAHLNAIAATFAAKFTHLPKELVRRVVEYAFHVGDY